MLFSLLSLLCNAHVKWISIKSELNLNVQIQIWIIIAYPNNQGKRSQREDTLMLLFTVVLLVLSIVHVLYQTLSKYLYFWINKWMISWIILHHLHTHFFLLIPSILNSINCVLFTSLAVQRIYLSVLYIIVYILTTTLKGVIFSQWAGVLLFEVIQPKGDCYFFNWID